MKFLVSYNGTKESRAALDLAQTHAKIFNARMMVVSSSEGGKGEKVEEINRIKQDLEKIQEEITGDGVNARWSNSPGALCRVRILYFLLKKMRLIRFMSAYARNQERAS